ncbi:MAG: nuclear transport factor 2 family protein [Sneathiella sp.]
MTEKLVPPFTRETALKKVQLAEDNWNTKDPVRISLAYSKNSEWRNRDVFFSGRASIQKFLTEKWEKELGYRLKKELWAYTDNRISVRFEYEWHDQAGQWFRTHGNEQWEFDEEGLMRRRDASLNDYAIRQDERRIAI